MKSLVKTNHAYQAQCRRGNFSGSKLVGPKANEQINFSMNLIVPMGVTWASWSFLDSLCPSWANVHKVPIPSNHSFTGQSLPKKGEIKIHKFEKELLGSEKNKCKNHHIHTFGFLCAHGKI